MLFPHHQSLNLLHKSRSLICLQRQSTNTSNLFNHLIDSELIGMDMNAKGITRQRLYTSINLIKDPSSASLPSTTQSLQQGFLGGCKRHMMKVYTSFLKTSR